MYKDFDMKATWKVMLLVVSGVLMMACVSGCGAKNGTTISDETTPLSDVATYESTIEVLEQGYAESFLSELEEDEQLVGSASDVFECQGQVPDFVPDWDEILATSPETVAYLVIPQAGITVPVMQKAGDQTYYDTHDAYGNENEYGAVHLDIGNTTEYTDPNTIIYGSNDAGGPFEYLGIYGNPEYFEANPFIYLYIPGYVYEYRVFAAMSGSDTDILSNINCYDFDVFDRYVNTIYSSRSMDAQKSDYLQEAVVNGWRMLTLSAGSGTEASNRYFVYSTYSGTQIQ